MLRICLCSDNHGDIDSIKRILNDNPTCDYYLHCGDACVEPEYMSPFACIKGNNDWDLDYPKERILDIANHKILMIHGDGYSFFKDRLAYKAKQDNCDVVFYGHTHTFKDEEIGGVRMINPGSCSYNRDYSCPCYAIVTIDDLGNIEVKRINLE